MATYAGYQAVSAPDLSAPFREQLAGLTARREKEAERKFQLEREDQKIKRAERNQVDASYKDTLIKIATASQTDFPDETFQNIVYNAAESERQLLVNAHEDYSNGVIGIGEYNKIEANIISDLTALSLYSKNAAPVAKEQSSRIQEGTAGYREEERTIYNEELSNLNNKRIVPNANGNLILETLDEKGNVVARNSITNMVSGNNLSNQFRDRVDVSAQTERIASGAAQYVTGGKTQISDPTKSENFDGYVKREIDLLMGVGTPQKNANILDLMGDGAMTYTIDVNGVEVDIPLNTFRTEKEKDKKIEETLQTLIDQDNIQLATEEDANNLREEIEKMMVPITIERGKDVYGISNFHIDLVKETLRKDVESKIDYKKIRTSTGTNTNKPVLTAADNRNMELALIVNKGISTGDFSGFRDNYIYDKQGDFIKISPKGNITDEMMEEYGLTNETIYLPLDSDDLGKILARYAGSTDPSLAASYYSLGTELLMSGLKPASVRIKGAQGDEILKKKND